MSVQSEASKPASASLQIFLSYSREDVVFARELREWLLEQGHRPWMDLFDIPAGARWPDEIDKALRSADVVIGLMSPASIASENVKNEWDWAIANNRRLLLLLVEPCEVPFHYVSRNYIDFSASREQGFEALAAAVHRSVERGQPANESVVAGAGEAPPPAQPGSRLRRALTRQRAAPVMVGREREQDELRRQLDEAINGEGGLILLGGEAGIGKTTLVRWLDAEAGAREVITLTGGCYDLATTPPYGPWVEILRAYESAVGLPAVPPQVRGDQAGLEAVASQTALFDLVGEFFAEVAERRSLLLILEDLHWADSASLEFLRFFARYLGGLPILLIASYRDDELTRRHPLFELMPRLVREAGAHRLYLQRLDEDAIGTLVTKRYKLSEADVDRLVAYLRRLAEGNLFFTGELLSTLEEEGRLVPNGDGWSLGELGDVPVPPLLRQVIEGRLQRLDSGARRLLELAAVIGQEPRIDLWERLSDADEGALGGAMRQAMETQLFEEASDGLSLRFRHALIRETLYAGIVPLDRRRWHREAASLLIEGAHPDPDEVVHHLEQAHDPRTVEWLKRSGERAARQFAWEVAIQRYERALELLERQPEPDLHEQCELLLALGEVRNLASGTGSGSPEAQAAFREAARIAREIQAPEQFARAALGVAGVNLVSAFGGQEQIDLLEQALEALSPEDSLLRARLMARLGNDLQHLGGDPARIRGLTEDAVAMARCLDDLSTLAFTLCAHFFANWTPDNIDERQAIEGELRGLVDTVRDPYTTMHWYPFALSLAVESFDMPRLREVLRLAEARFDEVGVTYFQYVLKLMQASQLLNAGRFAEGLALVEVGRRLRAGARGGWIAGHMDQVFMTYRRLGRLDEIAAEILRLAQQRPSYFPIQCLLILCEIERGNLLAARDRFERSLRSIFPDFDAIGYYRSQWLRAMVLIAEITVLLGDEERMPVVYERLEPYAGHVVYDLTISLYGSVAHYLGLLAGATGAWSEAEQHFAQALEAHRRIESPPLIAETQHAWAEMLVRRAEPGDDIRARELLDAALATAEELGIVRLIEQAGALRERLESRE